MKSPHRARAGWIKKFSISDGQPHGALASCGRPFAVSAEFRRQVDFTNEIVIHINSLDAMAAGLVRGMDNDLVHKLPQDNGGQLRGLGILLHDFQEALHIDGFGVLDDGTKSINRRFQFGLFRFVTLGQLGKPFRAQLTHYMILVKPLNDGVQLAYAVLLLFQLAFGLLLLRPLHHRFVFHHLPHKFVLILLDICHYPLEILEYKLLQYHRPDAMGGTLFLCTIAGAGIALLLMGPGDSTSMVHFRPTIGAVDQPGE